MADPQKATWWFDNAEAAQAHEEPAAGTGMNIGALMAGAQQLVEWASELVLAPHAEHADPAEHAECLICRGQQLLTSPLVQSAVANAAAGAVQFAASPKQAPSARTVRTQRPARTIEWIPVERLAPGASS